MRARSPVGRHLDHRVEMLNRVLDIARRRSALEIKAVESFAFK